MSYVYLLGEHAISMRKVIVRYDMNSLENSYWFSPINQSWVINRNVIRGVWDDPPMIRDIIDFIAEYSTEISNLDLVMRYFI